MTCPLCQSQSVYRFEAKGFAIKDCAACSHRFAEITCNEDHVESTYGDSYFLDGNAGYSNYLSDFEILRRRGEWYSKKLRKYLLPGSVLDIGCAAGFILKGFEDDGWTPIGVEPNLGMVRHGREQLGLDIRQGSLESFEIDERFDLISMVQVVGHFYDPPTAFKNAARLLKDDGHILIECWDQGSLAAKAFGKRWAEYSPPSVVHWFTKKRLAEFLKRCGFDLVAQGRPKKVISGAHVKSILKYRLGENALLQFIPDKVTIPYPPVDLFWALFKKDIKREHSGG